MYLKCSPREEKSSSSIAISSSWKVSLSSGRQKTNISTLLNWCTRYMPLIIQIPILLYFIIESDKKFRICLINDQANARSTTNITKFHKSKKSLRLGNIIQVILLLLFARPDIICICQTTQNCLYFIELISFILLFFNTKKPKGGIYRVAEPAAPASVRKQ
jgi:hypothetical protein